MMEFAYSDDDPVDMIAKARALADDIERILAKGGPSAADLGGAPVLDLYGAVSAPSDRLIGIVRGHPRLRDHRPILTSPLFLIDRAGGWARTWSRFYALGRPAECASARPQ